MCTLQKVSFEIDVNVICFRYIVRAKCDWVLQDEV